MESATTNYTQPPDSGSILQHISPNNDIDKILLYLLGLETRHNLKGTIRIPYIARVNRPIFSDDYARNLVGDLQSLLNFTVQVTKFDKEQIAMKCNHYIKSLTESLATHGDDHYISYGTWQKILDIHESKKDENGVSKGWYEFDIKWAYDEPVTFEMVHWCKQEDEEADQSIQFRRILRLFSSMVHASFNKSFSSADNQAGMLLGSMTQIRTESQVVREAEKKGIGSMFRRGDNNG